AISLCLGPALVRWLSSMKVGQPIRDDGPERHLSKAGTPTMGGVLILFSGALATLLLADLDNVYVWLALGVTVVCSSIGFVDDYRELRGQTAIGSAGKWRLALVVVAGVAAGLRFVLQPDFSTTLTFPLLHDVRPVLGWCYLSFAAFVIVGAANA